MINLKIFAMKKIFILCTLACISFSAFTQNVGIGTTSPNAAALLHINTGSSTKGILITGSYNISSSVPDFGSGSRFTFYPIKGAIRAGYVNSTQWDNANIGITSTAFGYGTTAIGVYSTSVGYVSTASGTASTAMGGSTAASGDYSTAMGNSAIASGSNSTAMGSSTKAIGLSSTAMGSSTNASGIKSTAMGSGTKANGTASTAMGDITTASGEYSTALGSTTTASGDYSFAAGRSVSTNNQAGSFIFGDSDPYNRGTRTIGVPDQFATRFNGGYYFLSSNAGADIGVRVVPGGNSWSAISDIHRKENFLPVSGESVLNKLAAMPLTTWNYKGQEKTFRHYGPMAQDFFAAFGKDDFGFVGCDTLINQQDFLGINLIAIQALEQRTEKLHEENEALKSVNDLQSVKLQKLQLKLEKIEKLLADKKAGR